MYIPSLKTFESRAYIVSRMGDHFALLVDRLLTEYTLEAAIQSKTHLPSDSTIEDKRTSFPIHRMDMNTGYLTNKLEECRICHDEDEESNMDIPCSCRGSLKYAHSKCVQRWCNEKGDTICEICHQQFRPGYTAPPPLFHYGGIPVNFRRDWEMPRRDLHAPQFVSMVSTDGSFLDTNFEEYPVHTSRSLMCCRIIAVIFTVLLFLRHTLPFVLYGAGDYSISVFMLLMLRMIGILLPILIMMKAFTAIQRRRRGQGPPIFPAASSDEENELPSLQPGFQFISIP